MASSSCSISCLPRSDDCPNCSRRALASMSFSRSISSRPTVTSLCAIVSISRCATIIACAAPRSSGSGSEGVITGPIQQIRRQKSSSIRSVSHLVTLHPATCGRQVSWGIRQSMPDKRYDS